MLVIRSLVLAAVLVLAACAGGNRPDPVAPPARDEGMAQAPPSPPPPVEPAPLPSAPSAPAPVEPAPAPPPPAPPAAMAKPAAPPAPVLAARPKPAAVPEAPAAPPPAVSAKPTPPSVPASAASASEAGASLSGQLELVAGPGQAIAAADLANAVVYFVPDAAGARPKPGRFTIYTHNKQFEPESLVVPLGSSISFPNQDEILHNVFSVTPASSFDLGLYGEGKSAEYTFKKPGLVLINCNVHHGMQANVLVVDTAHIARPDAGGRFDLGGLPAGTGKLMLWHPRAAIQTQAITLPVAGPIALKLVLSKPRITEHLNKERKPYAQAR